VNYVIAVQAPAYKLSDDTFATESAFAIHLRELRRTVGSRFDRLVLIAPQMTSAQYDMSKTHLGELSLAADGVEFAPAHSQAVSRLGFWLTQLFPVWRLARRVVRDAGIVHSGLASQLGHPLMAMVNIAAWWAQRPVVFILDIDFRRHAQRFYKTGQWSLKSYLVNRWVYDPLKWIQVWLAPRMFDLVCLKSAAMVRDFGQGRENVKNFYDTAHSEDDLLTTEQLQARVAWLQDRARPLNIAYFGRFAANKGLDRAVEALRLARACGAQVRLTLIGAGDCLEDLKGQVAGADLYPYVAFVPPVRYGTSLFELLEQVHVSVATPLIEDTPRAAFDSMARGLPVVAFDIEYFRELAAASGAVAISDWPDPAALAKQFVELDRDRKRLAEMAVRAVDFATENTQRIWIERRTQWILDFVAVRP
jgi:glycosyltransferase involved in cell wall biosynthesis